MKVTVTAESNGEVKKARTALDDALKQFTDENAELANLERQEEELTVKIEKMEGTIHPSDSKSIEALSKLKNHLHFVRERKERHSGRGTPTGDALTAELNRATAVIERALKPAQEEMEADIAKVFRPFFAARGFELPAARATDKVQRFGSFVHQRWGQYGPNVRQAKEALALMGEILVGEISWAFDPNTR